MGPSENNRTNGGSEAASKLSQVGGAPGRSLDSARKHRRDQPSVVGAVIDLGRCLDLTQVARLALVREAYQVLYDSFQASKQLDKMPRNAAGHQGEGDEAKRQLDCMVLNTLHATREDAGEPSFDTVRSTPTEGQPLCPGGKIMAKAHVQICVRNESNSIGYFHPRGAITGT